MLTTLVIDDIIYRRAKAKAEIEGKTMTEIVERALQAALAPVELASTQSEQSAWQKISRAIKRSPGWNKEMRRIEAQIEEEFEQIGDDEKRSPVLVREGWKETTRKKATAKR